jgi:hypothetical protein
MWDDYGGGDPPDKLFWTQTLPSRDMQGRKQNFKWCQKNWMRGASLRQEDYIDL